jgi:hypothetical protein
LLLNLSASHQGDRALSDHLPAEFAGRAEELDALLRVLLDRWAQLRAADRGGAILYGDERLARFASSILRARQRRVAYIDPLLLADPAWDMLLDLFVDAVRGGRMLTTSLCLATATSQAAALRWIEQLRQGGLLRRYRSVEDRRLHLVEITPAGFQLMRRYLHDTLAMQSKI